MQTPCLHPQVMTPVLAPCFVSIFKPSAQTRLFISPIKPTSSSVFMPPDDTSDCTPLDPCFDCLLVRAIAIHGSPLHKIHQYTWYTPIRYTWYTPIHGTPLHMVHPYIHGTPLHMIHHCTWYTTIHGFALYTPVHGAPLFC